MTNVRAAVLTGPSQITMAEFTFPQAGDDGAVIRIEAAGLCGSDVEQYLGEDPRVRYGIVPGHEPLGIIESIGPRAAEEWGVSVGDRICVEVVVPCRACSKCASAKFTECTDTLGSYGYRPFESPTPLTGGFAEYMYVHPNSVVHPIRTDVPITIAALYNPIAAGIRWACHLGGAGQGDVVVVFGAGQRGIAAALAAKDAGADTVIVTGLSRDAHKLRLAEKFGADATINAETEDVVARVLEITGGRLADVVLDITPVALDPIHHALQIVRIGGTVVIAGLKNGRPAPIVTDSLITKSITVRGARGVDAPAIRAAITMIESGQHPLELMHTHTFALPELSTALAVLAGDVPGEEAVHVIVVPSGNGGCPSTDQG
ncbi:alcohol dehydrogenase catalytic domain-containing protein [Microbacterium lushaniae]|nr:alcohol dehydrogenase catalytic domain-containing protein [Microbacterium lushaniae]